MLTRETVAVSEPKIGTNSNWLYRTVLTSYLDGSSRWLDLGCGHQLLPSWMGDAEQASRGLIGRCRMVVGLDRVQAALARHGTISHRVRGDSEVLPFQAGSFELVTANMVVEHIRNAGRFLTEVHRVLVPGGVFLFHTPNRHYYQILLSLLFPGALRRRAAATIEGRSPEDVFPTHYRMNTRREVVSLAGACGYTVDRLLLVNSSLTFGKYGALRHAERTIWRVLEEPSFEWGRSNIVAVLRRI